MEGLRKEARVVVLLDYMEGDERRESSDKSCGDFERDDRGREYK